MSCKWRRRPWEGAAEWVSKWLGDSTDAKTIAQRMGSFHALEVSRG